MLISLTKLERDVLVKACAELLAGEWDTTEKQRVALVSAQQKLLKQTTRQLLDTWFEDDAE